MLPLRSRTSWRLRALTVTCLPRDWTRAGVYHFANNRRRGHDLPEGHHGELAEQAWATRHTRQSLGLADPGPRQGHPDPRAFRSGRTLGRGRHCHVAGPAAQGGSLRRRHGNRPDQLRQQRNSRFCALAPARCRLSPATRCRTRSAAATRRICRGGEASSSADRRCARLAAPSLPAGRGRSGRATGRCC